MQVTDAMIDKLSRLAMLQFNEDEKETIRQDLEKMIGFIEKLQELDTEGVPPLLHLSKQTNVLRPDVAGSMLSAEEALRNAPAHNGRFFQVPRVLKKEE